MALACQECGEGRVSASVAGLAELCGHSRCDVRLLCVPVHGQVCGHSLAFPAFVIGDVLELSFDVGVPPPRLIGSLGRVVSLGFLRLSGCVMYLQQGSAVHQELWLACTRVSGAHYAPLS